MHLWMNIQVTFTCWLLEMTPQWTLVNIYVVELVLLFFSGEYPEVKLLDHMAVLFWIFEAPLYFSPQHSHQFTIPPEYTRAPFSPYPCQCFLFVVLIITILIVVGWYIMVVLMCLSLMINDVEHLLTFVSLFNIKRCCIKISCYDDGFISLLFLQAKCLQVYNNYNLCMNWPFNLGTHCIPNKYFFVLKFLFLWYE